MYISPASTPDKIREAYQEVSVAVDDKLVADATGRNALYKIHVSLGKIVNGLAEKEQGNGGKRAVSDSVRSTVSPDEKDTIKQDEEEDEKTEIASGGKGEEEVEVEDEEDDEGTVVVDGNQTRDSLVEDLLSDNEDEE